MKATSAERRTATSDEATRFFKHLLHLRLVREIRILENSGDVPSWGLIIASLPEVGIMSVRRCIIELEQLGVVEVDLPPGQRQGYSVRYAIDVDRVHQLFEESLRSIGFLIDESGELAFIDPPRQYSSANAGESICPAGMSLDRALEIATLALGVKSQNAVEEPHR